MTKRFLAFLSMLCCLGLASATAVFAQDVTPDPDDVELPGQDIPRERRAQTGFKFLSVSPDARAAGGMGDAFSAMKAGSIAMFYNPATMAYLDRKVHLAAGQGASRDRVDDSFPYEWQHGRGGRTSRHARKDGRASERVGLGTRTTRQRFGGLAPGCAGGRVDRAGWHRR